MSWGSAKSWSSVSESMSSLSSLSSSSGSSSEPPQWPPPYINARIIALVGDQRFEASVKLEPQSEPPVIHYSFHDSTIDLGAEIILYTALTPQQIDFSGVYLSSPPYFSAGFGPRVTVQPPTLNLQNSKWGYKIPWYAAVEMHIAYPGEP